MELDNEVLDDFFFRNDEHSASIPFAKKMSAFYRHKTMLSAVGPRFKADRTNRFLISRKQSIPRLHPFQYHSPNPKKSSIPVDLLF